MLATLIPIMTSCQTMVSSVNKQEKWSCIAYQPITWSSKDTKETILQIKTHNAVWTALCDTKHISEL